MMQVIIYQILVLGLLSQTVFAQQFITVLDSQGSTPIADVMIQSLNLEKLRLQIHPADLMR